ncbi:MAG TPA: alcohol dehydrogenase catalytic domain-containing protein [Candidatus Dormibacteraeota bacterium]
MHAVEDAAIEDATDVVVRVSSSTICGTDLHIYDGRTGAEPGLAIGHEPLGVVERAGSSVAVFGAATIGLLSAVQRPAARRRRGVRGRLRSRAAGPSRRTGGDSGRFHPADDQVVAGRARPGRIVSHHGGLDEAPGYYDRFDRPAEGLGKAVLHPNG